MGVNRVVPRWRPIPFLIFHLVAAALMASWLWSPTRSIWDGIDAAIFQWLNQTLALGRGWAAFWAVSSTRYFDLVIAAVIAGLILRTDLVFRRVEIRRAFFTIVSLVAILLILRVGFTTVVDGMGWQRGSPTRVTPEAIRLSHEFPGLKKYARLKDASSRSFPGDHASILLLWGLFTAMFARGKRILLPLGFAALFIMPRLIAGAHWFTDVVVGGTLLALLTIAWGYCTPGALWLSNALEKMASPVLDRLQRIPLLKTTAFFHKK